MHSWPVCSSREERVCVTDCSTLCFWLLPRGNTVPAGGGLGRAGSFKELKCGEKRPVCRDPGVKMA